VRVKLEFQNFMIHVILPTLVFSLFQSLVWWFFPQPIEAVLGTMVSLIALNFFATDSVRRMIFRSEINTQKIKPQEIDPGIVHTATKACVDGKVTVVVFSFDWENVFVEIDGRLKIFRGPANQDYRAKLEKAKIDGTSEVVQADGAMYYFYSIAVRNAEPRPLCDGF
jgi:hypothetical protein